MCLRRNTTDKEERKRLSKCIWKCLRAERKVRQDEQLDVLLQERKGKSELAKLLRRPIRRKRITATADSSGKKCTDPSDIAEVFASFYEDLYNAIAPAQGLDKWGASTSTPAPAPVTPDEVRKALAKLKSGRACGDDGLAAEMLKTDNKLLIEKIAEIFTNILQNS